MISILKSKFLVLGLVMIAVLLIPTMSDVEAANVGNGTYHVDVYDYPFEITLVNDGSITLHNTLDRNLDIGGPGWFRVNIAIGESETVDLNGINTQSMMGDPFYVRDWSTGDSYFGKINLISAPSDMVTPSDTFDPVLSLPNDYIFTSSSTSRQISVSEFISPWIGNFPPIASDAVDGIVTTTCTDQNDTEIYSGNYDSSGLPLATILSHTGGQNNWKENLQWSVGVNTVTCSASDAAGNDVIGSFTVTMHQISPAGIIGNGGSHPIVYDYPFDVNVQQGGSFTFINNSPRGVSFNSNWDQGIGGQANSGSSVTVDIPLSVPIGEKLYARDYDTGQSSYINVFAFSSGDTTNSTPTNSTSTNSTPTNSTSTNSTSTNSTPTNSTSTNSTSTNSTPTNSTPTNSITNTSFTATTTEQPGMNGNIDTCLGFENLPTGTQSVWLWGPQQGNSVYYYQGGQFLGGSNNIAGSTFFDGVQCHTSGTMIPGEYKFAALSHPEASPSSGNIIQFSSSIIIESAYNDDNFASEISPIIGSANYLAQTNQQAHEFSGNTAKVYVTFNENVPTMGSLINIVSVFPSAQNNLPLHCPNMNSSQCLDIPYTLTYPGGVEEGTITGINTTDHYDMVLSISNPPVAGHYVFQTELISTSFDVYDPNTAEGQQVSQEVEENMSSQISTITLEYVDQSDDRFFANESFTMQGNWNKHGQSNQSNTNQCHVWVSLNVYNSGGSYQQCTTSFPLYIMYYHPDSGTESRSTTLYTTLSVDSNGNFSTTLNANDIAYAGPGHYAIRAEPSVNDVFAHLEFYLIEESPNASIQLTSDKTILDRNISNDFAEVTINYQNLNSVADFIIQTPDGVERNIGGFSTSAYLTSGQQGITTGNVGIYDFTNSFNSFTYVIDDGATRGELEFQIVGTPQILANSTITTVAESGFSLDCANTGCYTPSIATVNVGDLINMTNTDPTGVHTFTSGTVDGFAPNPSGTFDSGVLMSGDSFTWRPQTDTDQPYYCMLHTWMVGTIVVGDVDVAEPIPELTDEEFNVTTAEKVTAGDLLKIDIIASHKTPIQIEISNTEGNSIQELTCITTTEFICETFWSVPKNTIPGTYIINANTTTSSDVTTFEIIEILEPTDKDTIPPTLTQNQNITVDATTSNGAIVNYSLPQATDDNSGVDLGPTCTPSSGSFFTIGTTDVTCSASDWAGNVGTTSFTVTVQSQIAAPIEVTTDVSITIGKSVYTTDDAIFVTGIATPFTEDNVSIQVEDSLENVVLVEQITPESSGIYTGIIFPNFLWSTSGNYTMSATYGNSTANTSFGFEFLEPVTDEYVSPTGINLQTDASMYVIGDTITIESALTDVGSDYQIGIFVEDPTGELRAMQFLNTDDSGSVSLSLKAQDNWIAGEYAVVAYDALGIYSGLNDAENIRKSVSFDLVKPIPAITISPTITTTESGNAITSYDAGDMAYFSTSLLSESTSDILVTINVVDADDTTLGVAFFKSIVGKGDSELVLGFKIPEDASDGAAKIYVNTYTDWIDNGGIIIGSELLSEVNIDGVIIEEPVVEVVEEPVLPENTIPRLSTVTDITQSASFTTGSVVSYSLPLATSGATTLDATCTPAPGSMFPIGSTQVTCTATNDFGNTGMTSFMVTINPILQTADQSLSVKVGKDLYNNLEPLFVTGSVGSVTGEPINLEVRDTQNNLISIEQVTPKESGVYSGVLTSNELWDNTGEYTIIAKYEGVIALDTFEFKLVEVEEVIPEKIPTSLFIDTLDSAYVLGDVVGIGVNLVDAGAGESILLEIKDSQNDQVLIQSLNTDSNGIAVFLHQLDSSGEPGVYSVTAVSDEWSFSNSENFIAVAQIPDITIGDVVSTLQDGTEVDSFESGDMGYFQTPVISESVSDVLITVNIFDVENTPLGLAYFNSKVVDDTFDIVLGLQIPQDAVPGLATVYINTYTDWPNEGGVPILEEQVSFIEISPASTTSLTVSSDESEPTAEVELIPITGNISVNTESTSYTTGNSIVISGSIQNLTEYEQAVVILIVSPDGNLVTIDQVSPDSSGNYSTTVIAGGTMNSSGEYEVRAQYGASKITSTFDFTSNRGLT